MREAKQVSIIMPVYNGATYIEQAIDSVFSQDHTQWQLIIVDDGSTDATYDIASTYVDPRVKVYRQANQGEAGARNTGLDEAVGEYVAFLDADDAYLPNGLKDLTDFLNQHPNYGVAFSNGYVCNSEMKPYTQLSEMRSGTYIGNILEPLVLTNDIITVPLCMMVRRSIIEREKSRFDTTLGYGTDWDLWIRLARQTEFGYLDKLTCMYRLHDNNMTKTVGESKRRADLARGRMKILDSEWFPELSIPTRRQFLHHLLIYLLDDDSAQQQKVLRSDAVRKLPPREQAGLWRQVGSHHLSILDETRFAKACLRESLQVHPPDWKSLYLMRVVETIGATATGYLLKVWNVTDQIAKRLQWNCLPHSKGLPTQYQLSNH